MVKLFDKLFKSKPTKFEIGNMSEAIMAQGRLIELYKIELEALREAYRGLREEHVQMNMQIKYLENEVSNLKKTCTHAVCPSPIQPPQYPKPEYDDCFRIICDDDGSFRIICDE